MTILRRGVWRLLFGDYVIDTLNAYSALQNIDFVNKTVWDCGDIQWRNVVFRAFAAKRDISKIVIWAGAVYTYEDLMEFRISDNSYQPPPQESERRKKREELFAAYGQFDPNSWFWKQVPGTNYLDGVKGEIQVHHAVNDNVINIGYSRNLMKILDGTSIPHQLWEYNSGGHNLTGSSFNQAMLQTVEFFSNR
jgi:hypothetical protein